MQKNRSKIKTPIILVAAVAVIVATAYFVHIKAIPRFVGSAVTFSVTMGLFWGWRSRKNTIGF